MPIKVKKIAKVFLTYSYINPKKAFLPVIPLYGQTFKKVTMSRGKFSQKGFVDIPRSVIFAAPNLPDKSIVY